MFKKLGFILLTIAAVACSKDEKEVVIDSSMPQDGFNVEKTGTIVAESDTGSKGTIDLGVDGKGTNFIHFGSDFETVLATGTLTLFLSTSDTYTADPMKGNPDLMQIGPVLANGEQYFKINGDVPAKFGYVILWCESAQIPFGYAELK